MGTGVSSKTAGRQSRKVVKTQFSFSALCSDSCETMTSLTYLCLWSVQIVSHTIILYDKTQEPPDHIQAVQYCTLSTGKWQNFHFFIFFAVWGILFLLLSQSQSQKMCKCVCLNRIAFTKSNAFKAWKKTRSPAAASWKQDDLKLETNFCFHEAANFANSVTVIGLLLLCY